MVKYMFQMPSDADFEMLYGNLKSQETIKFWSTSFLRGTTLDNSIIIVDEYQNLNFHELDSIITRVGENTRICFCGDAVQSDLQKSNERNGIHDFMSVLRKMPSFDIIEFGVNDIVRSGLVKEYILAKMEAGF
jgi:phosphate starvation-inducible protein PhoH